MRHTLAICALLLLAIFAQGQIISSAAAGQPWSTPLMGQPVLTGPTITFPPPTGGLIIQSGYATTAGWGYPPLVTTPTASFATLSANPVGATNATSNLQVGATNATAESDTVLAPAVQTAIEITQPGAVAMIGFVPPQGMLPQTARQAASSAGSAPGLGAAQFDVVNARGPGDTRSLGEVVRERRQQAKAAPVRTFTNDDVQRLQEQEQSSPHKPR